MSGITAAPTPSTSIATSNGSGMGKQPATGQGGKIRQTRRRQRLSCVECTKRRQKCDRQFPCGLCTSRGIPDLCRWEPIVVRPTPQRPPITPTTSAENATIEALSARIAALEEALRSSNGQRIPQRDNNPPSCSSFRSSTDYKGTNGFPSDPARGFENVATSSKTSGNGPRALLDFDVQVAAVALAQLSLAPRTEYVGAGTVICALHKLGDPESWRFPYSSTSLTSPTTVSASIQARHDAQHPLVSPIHILVNTLPPRPEVDRLLNIFFVERNWQFGISERWFRAAIQKMWKHLSLHCTPTCRIEGGCAACKEEVNPHWLSLLFSILALVPAPGQAAGDSAKYFMAALTAKRMVEDILLASPVYSTSEGAVHGSVLSCIAAVFLGIYQADRGRLSDALRSAQALGLHRDPSWGKWETMHKIEMELRVMGWWLLMISDRLYSFLLGRPAMVPKGSFDVFAVPTDVHGDGSLNEHGLFLRAYITLSGLINEAAEKCLGIKTPPYATVLDMDRSFEEWEAQLHPRLRWRASSTQKSPSAYQSTPPTDSLNLDPLCLERKYAYHKHALAGWYLVALMNIHRPYLMHPPPILPHPGAAAGSGTRAALNPSRERCIEIAMELTRLMTAFHDEARSWPNPGGLNTGTVSYFVFDGAVALAGALSQVPPHPQSEDCLALMDKSMRVLQELADETHDATDGLGEMPRRAITILKALRKAGGWDMSDEKKGDLVVLQDMLKKQRQQQRQQYQYQQQQQNPTPTHGLSSPLPSSSDSFGGFMSPSNVQYPTTSPSFGAPSNTTNWPLYIPFLNSQQNSPPSILVSNSNQSNSSGTAPGNTHPIIPSFSSFSGMDLSYSGLLAPMINPSNPEPLRPAQPMVMPFNVLQGVQPDMQGTANIDLDWARLAGMQSWYSNGANSSLDNSIIP